MKRFVRPAAIFLGLLLLACLGTLFFIDTLAKQAVERSGTYALGVETRLDHASIGLLSGEFGLGGLALANPPGFERPDFLSLRAARLELPLASFLESRITIPALELEGITVDLERNSKGTNYGVLLDHLSRFESGAGETPGEKPAPGSEKTFLVQRLVIRDVRATVNLLPSGGDLTRLDLAVPEIVVEDLASDMTMPQLCALVVKVVIRAAIQAGEGQVPGEFLADLRGRMDGLKEAAHAQASGKLGEVEGQMQEQAKKLGPDAEKAVEKASEELGKTLDGLFDKKKKDKKKN